MGIVKQQTAVLMLAGTVMRQYARAVTQSRQSEEVRLCFFGLFLFAF